MELEEYKELVSTYTKDPDVSKKTWAVSSKLCMLFVEFRHMDMIKHNLNNICNVYGGGETALVILYSGDNEDIIMETTKDWKNVIYRKMFDTNVTVKEYDRIFTSYDFWDSLSEFDYVLTNSWDSYIFKKIPDKFYKYDIVGGPCGHFFVPFEGRLMNICSNVCKCPRCLEYNHPFKESNFKDAPIKWILLNGGFFLRKVESAKNLCKIKQWSGEPDDVFFAVSDLTRPSKDEAREFGIQDYKYDGRPVGCHQLWIKHEREYVEKLFI